MKKIAAFLSILCLFSYSACIKDVSADHFVFPSTNEANNTNNWAHVEVVSVDVGEITLNFVNPRSFFSCFEYRTDATPENSLANYNPNAHGLYQFTCRNANNLELSFQTDEYVEVRMVFGAEADERFDWTRFEVLQDPDTDGDGVVDSADLCDEDTATDVGSWSEKLGINRYQYNAEAGYWETLVPGKGKKAAPQLQDSGYDIADTFGCSGQQILDLITEATSSEMEGHYKFGLSKSVFEDFILDGTDGVIDGLYFIETVDVMANDADGVASVASLELGKEYEFKAEGTADAGDGIEFDVDYSFRAASSSDWTDAVSTYEYLGDTLLDLMVNGAFINWDDDAVFNADHTYTYETTGNGSPALFKVNDTYPDNNSGLIAVSISEKLY